MKEIRTGPTLSLIIPALNEEALVEGVELVFLAIGAARAGADGGTVLAAGKGKSLPDIQRLLQERARTNRRPGQNAGAPLPPRPGIGAGSKVCRLGGC